MIEHLPLLTPDASRTVRTLTQCHHTLAAQRRRIEVRRRPNPKVIAAERLLLGGSCVAYLISMAGNVLRIVAVP